MRNRKSLVKEADRVFSIHIRLRGADWAGYNNCYTCGITLPWGQLQCGHFISRRFQNTRWHPLNAWPQCNRCNVELNGNLTVYENKLVAQYSQEAIDQLRELSHTNEGLTDTEINEIIKKYKSS